MLLSQSSMRSQPPSPPENMRGFTAGALFGFGMTLLALILVLIVIAVCWQ